MIIRVYGLPHRTISGRVPHEHLKGIFCEVPFFGASALLLLCMLHVVYS